MYQSILTLFLMMHPIRADRYNHPIRVFVKGGFLIDKRTKSHLIIRFIISVTCEYLLLLHVLCIMLHAVVQSFHRLQS